MNNPQSFSHSQDSLQLQYLIQHYFLKGQNLLSYNFRQHFGVTYGNTQEKNSFKALFEATFTGLSPSKQYGLDLLKADYK